MMFNHTPKKITKDILDWVTQISNGDLNYVKIKPEYPYGFCFLIIIRNMNQIITKQEIMNKDYSRFENVRFT